MLVTFDAPHENHPDFGALSLLRRTLDDGLASRLRQAISERRGLAYSVGASMDVYADVGALDIEAHCSPSKVVRTVSQIIATVGLLAQRGVGADELQRVRVRHRADLEFDLDDAESMCSWYGSSELVDCRATYADRMADATSVTGDDIAALAGRMFVRDRAIITIVGPVDVEDIPALEAMFGREPNSTVWLGQDEQTEVAELAVPYLAAG